MFTGVGGFELGLEKAEENNKEYSKRNISDTSNRGAKEVQCKRQYNCIGFSEIDKYASELLKNKWSNIKNYGDATKINPRELPDFDMLCGGFPCQAFSIAGKREGFKDTRGTMFFEIARIVKVKRPKTLLLENVKGLLNHEGGKTFRTILQTLSELGYNVQWMVLNSKFFGVPQNRERVFIIASLRGESRPEILPFGQGNKINNGKQEEQTTRCLTSQYYKQGQWEQYIKETIPKYTQYGKHQQDRIYEKDRPIGTLSSSQAGDYKFKIENMKIRRLTPTECERLQGFPDGWTEGFSDTQRYKMMGNAVTVNVVRAIAQRLKL